MTQKITTSLQNFTAIPEWKERLEAAANEFAEKRQTAKGRQEAEKYSGAYPPKAWFYAGADFARNEMQEEIDRLTEENYEKVSECKHYIAEMQEKIRRINSENDLLHERIRKDFSLYNSTNGEIVCLTKQRDDLQSELTLERGGSELWKRQRDELIEAIRESTQWISICEKLPPHKQMVLMMDYEGRQGVGDVEYGEFGDSYWRFSRYFQFVKGYRNNIEHESETQDKVVKWRPIDSPKATELLKQYEK